MVADQECRPEVEPVTPVYHSTTEPSAYFKYIAIFFGLVTDRTQFVFKFLAFPFHLETISTMINHHFKMPIGQNKISRKSINIFINSIYFSNNCTVTVADSFE